MSHAPLITAVRAAPRTSHRLGNPSFTPSHSQLHPHLQAISRNGPFRGYWVHVQSLDFLLPKRVQKYKVSLYVEWLTEKNRFGYGGLLSTCVTKTQLLSEQKDEACMPSGQKHFTSLTADSFISDIRTLGVLSSEPKPENSFPIGGVCG